MRIQCNVQGLIKRLERLNKNLETEMIGAIRQAANDVPVNVKSALNASIVRRNESEGDLEASIDGKIIQKADSIIAGVGEFDVMKEKAIYWQMIDEGSGALVGKVVPGWFVDTGGNRVPFDNGRTPGSVSTDRFFYIPQSGSFMTIRNEIKPHHYFESGLQMSRPKITRTFAEGIKRAVAGA